MTAPLTVIHRWRCAGCGLVVEHECGVMLGLLGPVMPQPYLPEGWHLCDGFVLCPKHPPHWHTDEPA